jgi:hypothetical protein
MLIIHHNDPDGRCAAAIVRLAMCLQDGISAEDMDFVELNYHTNDFRKVGPNERVFIVDYSLPPDIMNEVLEVTENVVLIDHHKSTEDRLDKYDGCFEHYCEFSGPNSGCMLAWKYFFGDMPVPEAVSFISDYDTWTHHHRPTSTYFVMGLNLFDCHPLSFIWDDLLGFTDVPTKKWSKPDYKVDDIIKIGKNCAEFRDALAKVACDEFGFEVEFEGHRCFAAYCTAMRSSLFFGDRINQYDMCIMVVPHGNGCTIRLYSGGEVDVSEIAKKYGGGGHVGAGGFVTKEIPKEFLPGRGI